METYKLLFKNRSLNEWEILDNNTNQKKTIDICDPHEHKLFSNDVFSPNNFNISSESFIFDIFPS